MDITIDSGFWMNFTLVLVGVIVLSIVVAAVWLYIFKEK